MHSNRERDGSRGVHPGGVGVAGLLGVAFVVLKLCGVIDWSWWYVTMPFWLPALVVAAVFALALAVILITDGVKAAIRARRGRRERPQHAREPEPLHGPVRKWGYRPADLERLRQHADNAGQPRVHPIPPRPTPPPRLSTGQPRRFGGDGAEHSLGIWPGDSSSASGGDCGPVTGSGGGSAGGGGGWGDGGGGGGGGGDGGGGCGGGGGGGD
jgi:hypothetical protein